MHYWRNGHAATLLTDGRVLVVGGFFEFSSSPAEIFDPNTGRWSVTSSAGVGHLDGTALITMTDGSVLLAGGGYEPYGWYTSTSQIFDLDTERWSDSGPMNSNREFAMAANLPDGGVLLAGGVSRYDWFCVFDCWYSPVYTSTAEILTSKTL